MNRHRGQVNFPSPLQLAKTVFSQLEHAGSELSAVLPSRRQWEANEQASLVRSLTIKRLLDLRRKRRVEVTGDAHSSAEYTEFPACPAAMDVWCP